MLPTVVALPIKDDKKGGLQGNDNCAGNGVPLCSRRRMVGNVAFFRLVGGLVGGGCCGGERCFFFRGSVRCFFVALNLMLKCMVVVWKHPVLWASIVIEQHAVAMLPC